MGDKDTFKERLESLEKDIEGISKITFATEDGKIQSEILNIEGKKGSLKIYLNITNEENKIGVEEARRGLEIFGEEFCNETEDNPESHPNIYYLQKVVKENLILNVKIYN